MKKEPNWVWPNGKRIAVVFNVCLEAWSDGKAPGISPMGNPLPGRRARYHGDLLGLLWRRGRHPPADGRLCATRRQGERHDQRHRRRALARDRQGHRRTRPRSAVAFLCDGCDPGAALRRGGAQEHRTLHHAARNGVGSRKSSAGCRRAAPRSRRRPSFSPKLATAGTAMYSTQTCLTSRTMAIRGLLQFRCPMTSMTCHR